ncbi:6-bladed beta-propeller [Echinicola sp. CAU 1574]|uniref:6-bladed beta-propeller n=1 Tax=Echinicola arenosa TaxID=2774144 RepID=A0ABR9AJY6_9BACT|nr:6-bladed beta-propeller [Echinicola arenosa]MBD8487924.1 6-bladed beta-propeller [Echinicola arenosa]
MKYNVILLLVSSVFLFQCQQETKTEQDIPVIIIDHDEKKELSLEDFAGDYREIPLEMTEMSFIKYINDIAVSDEHLYIDDVKIGILQFNKEGEFIKVIGKKAEEGPETYAYPTSIAFDEEEKAVIIADTYRFKVYKFNLEGRLIGETEKLPAEPIFVKTAQDGYWAVAEKFVTDGSGNSRFYREAEIYRFGNDLEILQEFTVDHLSLKSAWGAMRRQPSLITYSEYDSLNYFYNPILLPSRAYVGKFDRDTLYQAQEDRLLPKVRFEFSREIWDGEMKIFHIRNAMAYKQYYLVSYEYRSTPYLFIYDRSTKEGKVVQEGLSIPGLEEKYMPHSKSNGQMYLIVQRPPKPGEAEPNPSIFLF